MKVKILETHYLDSNGNAKYNPDYNVDDFNSYKDYVVATIELHMAFMVEKLLYGDKIIYRYTRHGVIKPITEEEFILRVI